MFVSVIFNRVQKMNIYESRKVMPDSEMYSASRQYDSWPLLAEPGRQINKGGLRGCDWVTNHKPSAVHKCSHV